MASDSHLLSAYSIDGSQPAFEELVRRHLPLVYRSALRQLNFDKHRADDVSQMVFLALARQAPRLISHTNLHAWLYSTTHRTTCQVLRSEMRRRRREQAWAAEEDSSPSGSASLWMRVAPTLDEAIRGLGMKDREVILLRFFGNHSFAEIGATFNIGEDAARMRVNRVVDKLRELLWRRGVGVTPASLAGLLASDTALSAPAVLASTIVGAAAQAGPAAVSVGSVLVSFMAASKLITTVVVLATVAALGVSLQQAHASRVAAQGLKSAQDEVASLQRRIAAAERPLDPAPQPSQSKGPPPAVVARDDLEAAERAKGDRFLAAHPEVRQALVQSQRARLRGKYLPLYHELKLTDAQIAAFEKILLGTTGRVSPNAGILYVEEFLLPDERDERLRAVIGERALALYKRALFSGNGYEMAQTLAKRLAFAAEPLTPEKSIAVRDIIDDARAPANGETNWTEAALRLGAVLTHSQMEEMNAVYAENLYQRARSASKSR